MRPAPSFFLLFVGSIALLLAACDRKDAQPSPSDSSQKPGAAPNQALLQARFGWLQKIPKDADFYFGLYDLSTAATKLIESRFVTDILSMPAVVEQLRAASLPTDVASLIDQIRRQSPDVALAQDYAAKLLGREFFFFVPAGTAEQLSQWRLFSEYAQLLQLETVLAESTPADATGEGQDAHQASIERRMREVLFGEKDGVLGKLRLPSLVLGFHAPDLKQEVAELLKEIKAGALPLNATFEKWSPIKSQEGIDRIIITGSAVLNEQREQELREMLMNLTGAKAETDLPDRIIHEIKKMRIQVALGYVEDHLIAAVGPDLDQLRLAENAVDSLPFSGALDRIRGLAGDQTYAISYASKAMFDAYAPRSNLALLFEAVRPGLTRLLPAEELDRLGSEFAKLDKRAQTFLPQASTSGCSILNVTNHLHFESFDGAPPFLTGTTASRVLTADKFPNAVLLFSNFSDSAALDAMLSWVSDLTALCYGSFDQHILPQMPSQDVQQFKMAEQIFLPKITTIFQLVKEFSINLTGPDSAFVLDFSGTLPAIDAIPKHFHSLSGAPRVAIVWQVKNADGLTQWANQLMKLANDIAAFLPPDANISLPLPQLQATAHPAGRSYKVPLPVDFGEWTPGATVLNSGFLIVGNHASIADSLTSGSASQKAPACEFVLRLKPLSKAAETWVSFAEKNKALLFADQPEQMAQFETSLPSLRHSVGMLDRFDGLHFVIETNEGMWRRVLKIGPGTFAGENQ